MAVDKKIKYDDKPKMQGGVQNYLGKQPQVMAPRKWQSSPDKPATELAYITEAEKNLILKANIHGGLEGGPNMGPSGIMSLDSFGDADAGVSGGLSGGDVSDAETGRSFAGANTISNKYGRDLRAGAVAAGGRQGLNEPQSVLDQVKALQKQFGPRVGTNKFGGVLSGLLGLVNPAFGFLSRGLGFLGTKLGDLRGYNPDGTPRTQAEYEAMVADRKAQTRIGNILGRDAPITEMTQRTLEKLGYTGDIPGIGSTPTSRAIARDLAINPEQPQFAQSYLNSISPTDIQQLAQPNIDRFTNPIGPRSVNMPTGIQTLDLGLPSNDLMAGLTRMQKMGLKSKKSNVKRGLMTPQDALDSITPFNDPDDPATIEEVKEYYGIA